MSRYKIGECVVEYTPIYPRLKKQMEIYRFAGKDREPDFSLFVTEQFCDEQYSKNPTATKEIYEYIYAGANFYIEYLAYGGFMLHSSAVVMDGNAYLFSADSGVGKSTHTEQWLKLFGNKAEILNDDKPLVCIEGDHCVAWGTPFSGKSDKNLNRKADLKGICMLERGEENKIWRITAAEAFPLVMRQTMHPRKEENVDRLLSILDIVLTKVPLYRMKCTVSQEAAQMAYERMSQ